MQQRKIYVASSWRNNLQGFIVEDLRRLGHEVYDFKNPPHGRGGFSWSDVDPEWKDWTPEKYREALRHPIAEAGYNSDLSGIVWADTCVIVLPCGRSAHTEAGYMKGLGKAVYVVQFDKHEPELMYKVFDGIITSGSELFNLFTIDTVQPKLFDTITTNSLESAGIFKKAFGENFNVKTVNDEK